MGQAVFRHAQLAWLLGFRSRAFRALAAIGVLLLFFAWLSGAFSLRQPAIVAMDVGISGLRFLGTFFVLYWVQEVFVRDVERRTIMLALAYPASRGSYLIGRWLGVVALVAVTIVVWASGLAILAHVSDWGYVESVRPQLGLAFPAVLFGVLMDMLVVSVFAVWLTSIAQTPMVPLLGGAGFAVAARFLGPSIDYLQFSISADQAMSARMLPILDAVRWVIPDLSRLDWRTAVLYGRWPSAAEMLGGTALALGYVLIFAALATRNYQHRDFS